MVEENVPSLLQRAGGKGAGEGMKARNWREQILPVNCDGLDFFSNLGSSCVENPCPKSRDTFPFLSFALLSFPLSFLLSSPLPLLHSPI